MNLLLEQLPKILQAATYIQVEHRKQIAENIQNCRVFVFPRPSEISFEKQQIPETISLPFNCCWLECVDRMPFFEFRDNENGTSIYLLGILVNEITPGVFTFLALGVIPEDTPVLLYSESDFSSGVKNFYETTRNLIIYFISLLGKNKNAIFLPPNPTYIKYKLGKKHKRRPVNEIIYIGDNAKEYASSVCGNIKEFSHRFEVRGHWRRLPEGQTGKDREGAYNTPGFTWVNPFTKGKEDLPLIKKVRKVM